jgi:hypothetical protein
MARLVFTPTEPTPTVQFGKLTLASQGGYPVTGTSISSGNSPAHWQISGGFLTPTALAVTDAYNGAPYTLTLNDDSVIEISCPDNVRHTRTLAEVQAALDAKTTLDGKTIKVRPGVKGGRLDYWGTTGTPPVLTIEADDSDDPPEFTYFETRGSNPNGNFTLRNLRFYVADVYPAKAPVYIRAAATTFFPVLLDGVEIEHRK